jgi:hypothetical protein
VSAFLEFLPESRIAFLDYIFSKSDILEIMESIQTQRPVVVAEQVVEIYVIVWLGHALSD